LDVCHHDVELKKREIELDQREVEFQAAMLEASLDDAIKDTSKVNVEGRSLTGNIARKLSVRI
jgi:hypothetical protein